MDSMNMDFNTKEMEYWIEIEGVKFPANDIETYWITNPLLNSDKYPLEGAFKFSLEGSIWEEDRKFKILSNVIAAVVVAIGLLKR